VAFLGRSQNCEKGLLALSCLSPSVGPSVRMEQLGFHWMDFFLNLVYAYLSKMC